MTGSVDIDRAGRCFVATVRAWMLPPIGDRYPGRRSRTARRRASVHQQGAVGLPEVGNVGPAIAVGDHRQAGVLRPQPCETSRLFLVAAVGGPERAVQTVLFGSVMAPFYLGAQRAFEA